MIQFLVRGRRFISVLLLLIFCFPSLAMILKVDMRPLNKVRPFTVRQAGKNIDANNRNQPVLKAEDWRAQNGTLSSAMDNGHSFAEHYSYDDIDGPSQPEMKSFQSIGSDNMVDLFTGDFRYSIPLMDVGGYPLNLFYNGAGSAEEDASWVGFGWNINPGTVQRNLRGLPDDFKGDEMVYGQNIKPNVTIGGRIGVAAGELLGQKIPKLGVQGSLGMSNNNYLGPSVELYKGISVSMDLVSFHNKANATEKNSSTTDTSKAFNPFSTLTAGGSGGVNLNSREGATVNAGMSLTYQYESKKRQMGVSENAGISYNARTGISQLQLSTSLRGYDKPEKAFKAPTSVTSIDLSNSIISFAKPSYIPMPRILQTASNFSGKIMLGTGIFGGKVSANAEISIASTEVSVEDREVRKAAYGYLYLQDAVGREAAEVDITRENDREVLPYTPIISAPIYNYDVFSIQGEGTGGTVRLRRNDIGVLHEPSIHSKSKSSSLGLEIDPPGYYGGDLMVSKTTSFSGDWINGNMLKTSLPFTSAKDGNPSVEFINPNEVSISNQTYFNAVGGIDLVRYELSGDGQFPKVEPKLRRFGHYARPSNEIINIAQQKELITKTKRTQVVSFLTMEEKRIAGLNKIESLYSFNSLVQMTAGGEFVLPKTVLTRPGGYDKDWHIGEITVTETSGQRYVYGFPVYNLEQQDYTFSTNATELNNQNSGLAEKVLVNPNEIGIDNPYTSKNNVNGIVMDGFVQMSKTPAYAHSFLLTGLLSADYVDVKGDGVTDDDLGTAIKFNYGHPNSNGGEMVIHQWRAPFPYQKGGVPTTKDYQANSNKGVLSETRDNKASITTGKKELVYLHSIESKTHVAIFKVSTNREDGKGFGMNVLKGELKISSDKVKLESIELYSKADLRLNGLSAKPIKKVHFEYDYNLCGGTPDNLTPGGGKLTLRKVWFSYYGQENRTNKQKYVFSYAPTAALEAQGSDHNPNYSQSSVDRWGVYKNSVDNPSALLNSEYPYALQNASKANMNASVWMLKRILLPSGGQIEVDYESDSYAYVAAKRAARMYEVAGFSVDLNFSGVANKEQWLKQSIYNPITNEDYHYVYVRLGQNCPVSDLQSLEARKYLWQYLVGINQLYCKLKVVVPKGSEWVEAYLLPEQLSPPQELSSSNYWGFLTNNIAYIKISTIQEKSSLRHIVANFMRENLPGQVFPGYDLAGEPVLSQVSGMLFGLATAMANMFTKPDEFMRKSGLGRLVLTNQSFVRLNAADGIKFGGGHRVKEVRLKDNFSAMTGGGNGQFGVTYGQRYQYTTDDNSFGDDLQPISSGVASYEPAIGNEENPYTEAIHLEKTLPLGPSSYGAIIGPVGSALFNAPVVGYSKVTVVPINRLAVNNNKPKSAVGKQVTEFYTAKDYPPVFSNTLIEGNANKTWSATSVGSIIWSYQLYRRAVSQGFLVLLNDMHGKMKQQAAFGAADATVPITQTKYFYTNTGKNGLGDQVDFVFAREEGSIRKGNLGIDIELMSDTREFGTKSRMNDFQIQVSLFPLFVPVWAPFPWYNGSETESLFRSVTVTKLVNFHAILQRVEVIDKGSQVSTENLVYDAETGNVVVSKSSNHFNKPVYQVNYPAWWAYEGMAAASNTGTVIQGLSIVNGKITTPGWDKAKQTLTFENGDELLVTQTGSATSLNCVPQLNSSAAVRTIWALDEARFASDSKGIRNQSVNKDFVFIDDEGKPYSRNNVDLRIIRSGRRNMLDAVLAQTSLLVSPISGTSPNIKLSIPVANGAVIGASAIEYTDRWKMDQDVILKHTFLKDCIEDAPVYLCVADGNADRVNPFRAGLLGRFSESAQWKYYTDRAEKSNLITTNIAANGAFVNSSGMDAFVPLWVFATGMSGLIRNTAAAGEWVKAEEVTRKNKQGLQVETKNALGIYSAAKYSALTQLPEYIVNNSDRSSSLYMGFEEQVLEPTGMSSFSTNALCKGGDGVFTGGQLPGVVANLLQMSNGSYRAHTGRMALKINGTTNLVSVPLLTRSQPLSNEYSINPILANRPNLSNLGVTAYDLNPYSNTVVTVSPFSSELNEPGFAFNVDMSSWSDPALAGGPQTIGFSMKSLHYIDVGSKGSYSFNLSHIVNGLVYSSEGSESWSSWVNLEIAAYNDPGFLYPIATSQDFVDDVYNEFQEIRTDIYSIQNLEAGKYIVRITYGGNHTYAPGVSDFISYMPYVFLPFTYRFCASEEYFDLSTTTCIYNKPIPVIQDMVNKEFIPETGKQYQISAWVKRDCSTPCQQTTFDQATIEVFSGSQVFGTANFTGPIIEGWQKMEGSFTIPVGVSTVQLRIKNTAGTVLYLDDLRIHPYLANMKSFVYDPISLRLISELDENNFARFYEYDEEGGLIRTKVETERGIKTITETKSHVQKAISQLQ